MVAGYGTNEVDGEERDKFWNDMDRVPDRLSNCYRLFILVDLNKYFWRWTRAAITGVFGVLRENDKGRRVVEFGAERRLCMGTIYFKSKSLHRYTKVAMGQDGVEVKNMTDLVLVKKDMLRYV